MKNLFLIILFACFICQFPKAQIVKSEKSSIVFNNKKVEDNKVSMPGASTNNTTENNNGKTELSIGEGKYYALIIGISNYTDPQINALDKPIKDAQLFYKTIVTRYNFDKENVRFLPDATMSEIVSALDYYARQVTSLDNVLIFYAGHGYWNPASEVGFWIPSDARKSSTLNWFRNSTLRDYLREINSKHTLLISDACFGGSIFKSRSAFTGANLATNKLYELPSRKAMTSGTLTEVPDQSAFLKYLIERLNQNMEKYLSSEQLFSSFRIAVINNSNVVPQFGEVKDVGDEGGDFIFILK